jgi:hypothetical protein
MKTLARYVARLRRERGGSDSKPRWVAVEVAESGTHNAGLAVLLAGGGRIEVRRGFDSDTLRRVVAALERA